MRCSGGGIPIVVLLALLGSVAVAGAATHVVAESGGDFTSIQAALDAAQAGDVIQVREKATPYFERIVFPRSGLWLEAFAGERPVIDGSGVPGDHLVVIDTLSNVGIVGFELRNNLNVEDGSAIRVHGSGSNIEIRDNVIHELRGEDAMAITVYGTSPSLPIRNIVIDGNEVYDAEPNPSEAITLNGNVLFFEVTNNYVHDVNNIGIDFIGGETDINPAPTAVARQGVCRANRVERARNAINGFSAGIYVDGGRDIVIERNEVSESNLGIEVGAENAGVDAMRITVRSNVIHDNDRAGLVFGGYNASVGRTRDSSFLNNTIWRNDVLGEGYGQVWIQHAEDNTVANNIVASPDEELLLHAIAGSGSTDVDYNLWFGPGGPAAARFIWNGVEHTDFDAYRSTTGQDAHSFFSDPGIAAPHTGDFHLAVGSLARDAGDPALAVTPDFRDLDGQPRLFGGRVDIGADEVFPSNVPALSALGLAVCAALLAASARFVGRPQ